MKYLHLFFNLSGNFGMAFLLTILNINCTIIWFIWPQRVKQNHSIDFERQYLQPAVAFLRISTGGLLITFASLLLWMDVLALWLKVLCIAMIIIAIASLVKYIILLMYIKKP